MADKYSPELIGSFEQRNCFVVPAKMLAAVATKGHPPTVSWKPGMSLGGWTVRHYTWAGIEGVEIAFYPGRIHETVSTCSTYAKKPVRVGDQAAAGNALVSFGAVATHSVCGRSKTHHIGFQLKIGCLFAPRDENALTRGPSTANK